MNLGRFISSTLLQDIKNICFCLQDKILANVRRRTPHRWNINSYIHCPIMLTIETSDHDAMTTVTLLAMLKITRPYTCKVRIGQTQ